MAWFNMHQKLQYNKINCIHILKLETLTTKTILSLDPILSILEQL
jgi:hypothetical protein